MATVQEDVTNPLTAVSAVMQGMAAKNQTMKDGPPSGGSGGGGTQSKPKPSPADKKSAYDKYKQDIKDAWAKNTGADGTIADPTMLGLDIAQAIADLAMGAGGDVLKALGDLAKIKSK